MKEHNNNPVKYPNPLGASAKPRRRGYWGINLDDRLAQYRAMMAHLRATGYPVSQRESLPASDSGVSGGRSTIESLLDLSRRYDAQASRNFIRDAALLAVIVAIPAWAFIHAVQAFAGP